MIKTYEGLLSLHSYGEADDILFLSSERDPLCEVFEDSLARKLVTIRYWITDTQATKEQAQESFIRKLYGETYCKFGARYSELTGYLWTDEKCQIGGHDLIKELKSYIGKWLILEVNIHEEKS